MTYFLRFLRESLRPRLLMPLLLLSVFIKLPAQAQTTIATASGVQNTETVNTVTFNFQNTNAYPVIITNVEGVLSSYGTVAVEMWYKPSAITAAPGLINTAAGWTQVAANTISGIDNSTGTATQPFFNSLAFTVPANSTYGIVVAASINGTGALRIGSAPTPVTIGSGNCNFLSGPGIGFASADLLPAAPTLTSRGWLGKLMFIPGNSCGGTPATPAISGPLNICSGSLFSLSGTGYTVGAGLTYQWQRYNSTLSAWEDINLATDPAAYTNSAGITTATQYRLKTTCTAGGTSSYSNTLTVGIGTGLPGGTYTINKNAPSSATNFISFNAAAAAIKCGITGLVNLNVVPGSGPYTEQVLFNNVPGTSAANQIRLNGNGEVLQFESPSQTGNTGILTLSGTHYMTIDTLVLRSISQLAGVGIVLADTATRDSVKRCFIDMRSLTATLAGYTGGISLSNYYTASGYYSNAQRVYIGHNYILGNTGAGGPYYGIGDSYYTNLNYSNVDSGNVIEYNEIENVQYAGIQTYANKGTTISFNNIHRTYKQTPSYFVGIRCYSGWNANNATTYDADVKIVGNRIHDPSANGVSANGFIGIYVDDWYYVNNQSYSYNTLIANNAIYNVANNSSSYVYGIFYGGGNGSGGNDTVRIFHNTIDINGTGSAANTVIGIYFNNYYYNQQNPSIIQVKNNLVTLSSGSGGDKFGLWFNNYLNQNQFILDAQRNNVYYSTSASNQYFCYYNGVNYPTLASFQTAFPTQETGTLSVNPQYTSPATGDFTPLNFSLFGNGTNLLSFVPKDILGRNRTTAPTPGAFEVAVDAGVNALLSPVGTYCSSIKLVKVSVRNTGIIPINTVQVNWSLNGVLQPPVSYSSTIAPNGSAAVSLGNGLFMPATPVTIKAWTSMPNGQPDGVPANDTLVVTTQSSTSVPVDIGPDDTVCTGSTVTLDAGYPGATYVWDNMATTQLRTIQNAGTYYVRITALDGCIGVDTMKLSLRPLPVVDLGPDREICEGSVTTFDAGHPGDFYLWDDGSTLQTRTVDTAGDYEVQVTDMYGCTGVDNISVGMKDLPFVDGINATHADSGLYTFYPLNPRYAISYRWNFGDNSPEQMGYMVQHQYRQNGIYTVTLYMEGECTGLIINNVRTVDVFNAYGGGSTGIGSINLEGSIAVYPNPANDRLLIDNRSDTHMQRIAVYNALGQLVLDQSTDGNKQQELHIAAFASGLYTIRIETDNGTWSQKFEIRR